MKFAVRKRRAPSIIIVSLVDILTILLIFFVVSTTFKKDQPEVQINLAGIENRDESAGRSGTRDREVDQSDEIKLDGQIDQRRPTGGGGARFVAGAQSHACLAS